MRPWGVRRFLLLLGVAGSAACGGSSGARAGPCDQAELRTAAAATDAMLAAWNPAGGTVPDYRVAVRGIQQACARLPAGFHAYLEHDVQPRPQQRRELGLETPLHQDPEALRPMRAHCPGYAMVMASLAAVDSSARTETLYDGCGFAGLGLIDRSELGDTIDHPMIDHGHALYLWLVDDGAPPEVARALVRPILAGTDAVLEAARHRPHLPMAARGSTPSLYLPDVRITMDGVIAEHEPQVRLEQGRLVDADHDGERIFALKQTLVLAAGRQQLLKRDPEHPPKPLRITIAAEPQLRWATVGLVALTAREAGYVHIDAYALVPAPLRPLVVLPLVTPSLEVSGPAPKLELALTEASIVLRCEGGETAPDLTTLAAAVDRCGGGALRLRVAPETRWQRVIDMLAELDDHATIAELAILG